MRIMVIEIDKMENENWNGQSIILVSLSEFVNSPYLENSGICWFWNTCCNENACNFCYIEITNTFKNRKEAADGDMVKTR